MEIHKLPITSFIQDSLNINGAKSASIKKELVTPCTKRTQSKVKLCSLERKSIIVFNVYYRKINAEIEKYVKGIHYNELRYVQRFKGWLLKHF